MRSTRLSLLLLCSLAAPASRAQVINDDPCSAIAIALSDTCAPVNASNVNATATDGIPVPACGNYQGNDVWFLFTAPVGIVDITMTAASFADGAMALYSADSCDGAFTLVACDDDTGPGLLPRISREDLEPGSVYWIRAFGYGADTGTFSLCVTGPSALPAGDCIYRLELFDSFGDGWEGASVAASVNGGGPEVLSCDDHYGSMLIGLYAGDVLTLTYSPGANDTENRFWLRFGMNGPAVYDSGSPPSEGLAFTLENTCSSGIAPPTDCAYRVPVCADTTFPGGSNSTGTVVDLNMMNQGCMVSGERSGIWTELLIAESGSLGFTMTPASNADLDFALWGPFGNVVCPMPNAPLRCSYAAAPGPTGLLGSAIDVSEGAGGDRFVDTVHVTAGQRYVLFIDNFSSNGSGMDLTFQLFGGAALACTPLPEASFIASDNAVLTDEPVSFTDQSSGSPYGWLWSFPGATENLSLAQHPQGITYPLPGCYDVSLTTTNIAGSDATTHVCEVEVSVSSTVTGAEASPITVRWDSGVLLIDRPGRNDLLQAMLIAASGQVVDRFTDRGPHITHSMALHASGCYSLVFKDGPGIRALRFVLFP